MRKITWGLCLAFLGYVPFASPVEAVGFDIYENQSGSLALIGTITAFDSANTAAVTAADHYSYVSSSGHPEGVNLGGDHANLWVWDNDFSGTTWGFGFIFGEDNSSPSNSVELIVRIAGSASAAPVVIDDPGELVFDASEGVYRGDFAGSNNSDGFMLDNIASGATVIIDSVEFGSITSWYAASAETNAFSDDLSLTIASEYRIVRAGVTPSAIPEPTTALLLGLGLVGLAVKRRA
ncbi:MAG TPA: PEP-CTERM sorting domain-containing protein [Myxococcales bacterium]|nr:PEP-CTERM sorting domain-containing protein [Myxococcales bacterium]